MRADCPLQNQTSKRRRRCGQREINTYGLMRKTAAGVKAAETSRRSPRVETLRETRQRQAEGRGKMENVESVKL
ncbi:hypothetical protein BCR44DRAFT_1215063 [Catenaria anguillulae PL171]|uniref:Uncharacterized protein n=1 Tax=Catenaria anguillulae PL171 TaxID=765915 RepID=A0A1Y2HYS8_9FUNG|nr:hypothetical protein BCR44DRAFT_1215063 [Catenaria anguillulae PL171]